MLKRIHRIHRSFRAPDGTEFGMKSEALAWEHELLLRAWIEKHLEIEDASSVRAFATRMIQDRNELRLLLSKLFLDTPPISINKPAIEETEGNDNVNAKRPSRAKRKA